MLKARTRWQVASYDEAITSELAQACGISPLLARLLAIRGLDTPERAKAFLHVSEEQFHSPYLLDGMEQAVLRIRQAIETGEAICIYGDYDADGVSSTSLMVHLMRELGANFDYYIPNRFKEGYGLNKEALTHLAQSGVKLVITVDTGISAVEQVEHGQQLGMDIIVTDHHEPPAVIPDAYAVINPKKLGCTYPFDMLAGVGVAFKLAHALLEKPPMHLIDLAAIGTIADLVPLVDENRIFAALGLRRLNATRNIGLKSLIRVCGLEETELSAGQVGFAIGPRINASGRLETAEAAVKLLTATDTVEADRYAIELDQLNQERQELVAQMAEEAIAMVEREFPIETSPVLVVAQEGWNVGVVGIVASRLVETFYRPTIVLGIDLEKGIAKGSARSIAGFDMYEALTACKDLLPHYGGHVMAAGMTLPIENVDLLRERLKEVANECLTPEDYVPITKVDLATTIDEIGLDLAEQLEALAPFGMGNTTPILLIDEVAAADIRKIGRDENHLKCTLANGTKNLDAIGFKLAHLGDQFTPKAKLAVVGELSVNEWNGKRKPQVIIRDASIPHLQVFDWRGSREKRAKWRQLAREKHALTVVFHEESIPGLDELMRKEPEGVAAPASYLHWSSDVQETVPKECRWLILYDMPTRRAALSSLLAASPQLERIYCIFGDPEHGLDQIQFPRQEQFKQLYQFMRQYPAIKKIHLDALAKRQQLKPDILKRMLAVFLELSFITETEAEYVLNPQPAKSALDRSAYFQSWQEEAEMATELLLSSHESLIHYLTTWMATTPS
ncbi:single-stranded-DNA-specific exonuclease RecJ [Brevibacillus fluminis]|uniref:Single-stranded-DNA-specific exonuclease RecJ n=1 Tax=Brevibacillus fluminis TaxID=511487 RepID=A0A3M8DRU1_9BACL|nr:single-stranded-DNA-specific exonuclease RecJ [Brevibacillus fluminis]RNB90614.1 single-stranded-DNA-specific exonuclease RecJ [Brevibacillus fluminis]